MFSLKTHYFKVVYLELIDFNTCADQIQKSLNITKSQGFLNSTEAKQNKTTVQITFSIQNGKQKKKIKVNPDYSYHYNLLNILEYPWRDDNSNQRACMWMLVRTVGLNYDSALVLARPPWTSF